MTLRVPRWALWLGALLLSAALGALIAVLASSDDGAQAVAEPAPVTTTTTTTVTESQEDVASAASEVGETTSKGARRFAQDCDALGINSEGLKEGTCRTEGQRVTVVNRDRKLKLKELDVRLLSIDTPGRTLSSDLGTERANGTFVIVRLAVTNKLNAPVYFEDGFEPQVYLTLGDGVQDVYTPHFDAANGQVEDSFVWQGEEIQPKTTQEGAVIFDIPRRAVGALDRTGNLRILNFSDVERNRARLPIGVIRTYT